MFTFVIEVRAYLKLLTSQSQLHDRYGFSLALDLARINNVTRAHRKQKKKKATSHDKKFQILSGTK